MATGDDGIQGRATFATAVRAEIHERRGETERARELWTQLLALWTNGDPDHPLMQRAREALGPG